MPDGLTHLWLTTEWRGSPSLGWQRDAGWTRPPGVTARLGSEPAEVATAEVAATEVTATAAPVAAARPVATGVGAA